MGEAAWNAQELWAYPRSFQKCRNYLPGSLEYGNQIFDCVCIFHRKLDRPKEEVNALMKLLRNYMKNCIKTAEKNHMRVRVIGDTSKLDADIQESIRRLEDFSKDQDGLNFQIAINYGSRDEMLRGMKQMLTDYKEGRFALEELDERRFESYLDTRDIPAPDLLIRTSGEQRLSNYLLWQLAYSELYFTDVSWPDFTKKELEKAIQDYNKRDRRFGGVGDATEHLPKAGKE